ncbi:MAG: hypothetical protein A2289_16405 [Deltaproteobacteria bacterium RIFOXYA12_FULL_58_15]|nr:MAG: hypothetical protein A2289_16405 [Deltaproteobacteria bacterium RIFOXYA12_FULL_58_15]
MDKSYRRVNITISEAQYAQLAELGLNFSGLVRDLLGDYLSENVISLQVTEKTRQIYDLIVSNTGSTDQEIEVHLRQALAEVLKKRIAEMEELRAQLEVEVDIEEQKKIR